MTIVHTALERKAFQSGIYHCKIPNGKTPIWAQWRAEAWGTGLFDLPPADRDEHIPLPG